MTDQTDHYISKDTGTQRNLLDGTILYYEPRADGAFVTIAGRDGEPAIVAFDRDDMKHLKFVNAAVGAFDRSTTQEDRIRITPAGVKVLQLAFHASDTKSVEPEPDSESLSLFAEPVGMPLARGGSVVVGAGDDVEGTFALLSITGGDLLTVKELDTVIKLLQDLRAGLED